MIYEAWVEISYKTVVYVETDNEERIKEALADSDSIPDDANVRIIRISNEEGVAK